MPREPHDLRVVEGLMEDLEGPEAVRVYGLLGF
jgi:hypothetical protein